VRRVLGPERYEFLFDRLLTSFFDEPDARFMADGATPAEIVAPVQDLMAREPLLAALAAESPDDRKLPA